MAVRMVHEHLATAQYRRTRRPRSNRVGQVPWAAPIFANGHQRTSGRPPGPLQGSGQYGRANRRLLYGQGAWLGPAFSRILQGHLNHPGAFMGTVTMAVANLSPVDFGTPRGGGTDLGHCGNKASVSRVLRSTLNPEYEQSAMVRGREWFVRNGFGALSSTEQQKDRGGPGRRGTGSSGESENADRPSFVANHADPQLRAATEMSIDLLHKDGEVDAAHRVLVAAIGSSLSRFDQDGPGLVEALETLSVVCYFGRRAELWVSFERTLEMLGDTVPPVLRLLARACLDPDPHAATAAAALDVEAWVNRLPSGDPHPARTVHIGMLSHVLGRLPECRGALHRVFVGAGDKTANDWTARAGLLLAVDAADAGNWADAEAFAADCIRLCESTGQRLWAWFGRAVLALVAAGRGRWEECGALTNEVHEWATPRGVLRLIHDAHDPQFLAALGRGDRYGAFVAVAPRTRAPVLAATQLAEISPRLALQAAGVTASKAPDEVAVQLFRAALDIPGIERWPFEVALVQLAFGERLRRCRAARASREQLAAALGTFTRLGAQPWVERASAELRATGQTRRRSDSGSPVSLTAQEYGVAELAATGLTNKQIGAQLHLSPRTVSAHLYRVFPKLGITSRAALRDALRALPASA